MTEPAQHMDANEEYVRSRWEGVKFAQSHQYGDATKPIYWLFYIDDWLAVSGYDTREKILQAAAEFTRERERQIAEMSLAMETAFCADPKELNCVTCEITQPLRKLGEAALAELTRGMKEPHHD